MKQLLQDLSKGDTTIMDVPMPAAVPGTVVIAATVSLISAGTERMLVDFGRAGYLQKARQQPDKVRMVLEKARTDGIAATYEAVRAKLDQPLPLGYSAVGVVMAESETGFKPGDRVVSNGPHAEVVRVPRNLCAKIPDTVSDEAAAFTVMGAIALQGLRLAGPALGEAFVVTGAGLIGLIAVQLLRASGCRVLAIDFDAHKLELARRFGATTCNPGRGEDPVAAGMTFSRGKGVDGVIIAAATTSNDPVSQAARMSRKRGRIVLVGVAGLTLNRADFYEKELTFQVSCSYGPGRYDPEYEDRGHDYPHGFVRWTEQRNFEAVLDMMADGRLDVLPLISHRFAFEEAARAYDLLSGNEAPYLGILLIYQGLAGSASRDMAQTVRLNPESRAPASQAASQTDKQETGRDKPVVAFVGAGNYAARVLIPAFRSAGAHLRGIAASGGVSSAIHGKKAGFDYATTDVDAMLADDKVNTMVIATRHDTHAEYVLKSMDAGKHVFVEKPLCLTLAELDAITEKATSGTGHGFLLMVGFNRRFAPHIRKMKALVDGVGEPKSFIMTMNAGAIPAGHWTQDKRAGGGRIMGEACHYIDLMRFLAGSPIISVQARCMGAAPGMDVTMDKAAIILGFADGSFGTIHYLANGHAGFPKERIEVFCAGRVLQLDNFRKLRGYGWPGFKTMNQWRQDKGQSACVAAFLSAVNPGAPASGPLVFPIPLDEILEVARVSIEAGELLENQ